MKNSRSSIFDFALPLVLSTVFCSLLVKQIMAGGLGKSMSFIEFFSVPDNFIFCLLMTSFLFASWLVKGINNKVVLVSWAIVSVLHQVIFWATYKLFYYQSLNIYLLNFVGVISTLPAVLFLKYRVTYSKYLFEWFRLFGVYRKEIDHYLTNAKTTDFEFFMRTALYLGFSVELTYSCYQTLYSLFNRIPYNGSVYENIIKNNHWDPFYLYTWCTLLIGVLYILIIVFHIFRDHKVHDAFLYGLSRQDKRKIALKILQETRAKAKEQNIKKRD